MTDLQETFIIAELVKTQADLRESIDSLTTALKKLQSEGLPQSLPKTLSVDQAAKFCQVKEGTIRNWASRGKIPCHRANGFCFSS